MVTDLERNVDVAGNALFQIRDMFEDPSEVAFDDVRESMEKLEAIFNAKALIDAAFAHICERDEAGRRVGAKHPNAYLKQCLGLSPKEAYDRLARGKDLFAEPPAPGTGEHKSDADGQSTGNDGDSAQDAAARDAAEREREERERLAREDQERARQQARKNQQKARGQASRVSSEKQAAIRQELDNLLDAAQGERQRLLADAMREALTRDVVDLRATVRRWVNEENRKHRQPHNPNAGMEKRGVFVGQRKADGTFDIRITGVAGDTALIKALLDKGAAPNSNLPEGVEDYRSPSQRRYDQLMQIFKHYDSCKQQREANGCASVVVSVTLDDLADADATMRFSTNTGIDLDCFDLVRLGMDGTADFVLTVEGATGVPLNLQRSTRIASIAQRVVLLAVDGVCAWSGCSAPLSECEAHHVLAWIRGGNTDIANLTPLCREHHRQNNDHWDHRYNKSHMEYEPGEGRAGLRRRGRGNLEFNQSDGARHSAVRRLRTRGRPENHGQPRDPGQSEFQLVLQGQDPDPPF